MQNAREIKRRIKSVKNTQQITRAMEMVSAAKLQKAQTRVENARPYEQKMRRSILRVINQVKGVEHPFLEEKNSENSGYIVITSDRGLCGGYNINILKTAMKHIGENTSTAKIIAVGRKSRDYFKKKGLDIIAEYVELDDYPSFSQAQDIIDPCRQLFLDEGIGKLYLVYSEFINAMIQRPTVKQVLPVDQEGLSEKPEFVKEVEEEAALDEQIYKFEPSLEVVLNGFLEQYLESLAFRGLLEAKASEHGARRTAMSSATDNAEEMIDELTLSYNRARQAGITQEIMEIVGGAEALD